MTEETVIPPQMPGMRQGLRVVVSAGAAGIGRAIAEAFIANGARVVVSDVNETAIETFRQAQPSHLALKANAGVEGDVDVFMNQALTHLGGLDVLVNNAGIAGPTAPVESMDADAWRQTMAVNLDGVFYHTRRGVPALRDAAREHGEAWIINLSSIAGRLGFAYHTPYSATKWGVVGLTESLSLELGRDGIRVNAILPGIVESARVQRLAKARAEASGITEEEALAKGLEYVALGRTVTAQDVANMALVLCSPLGHNIAGQALSVCGHVYAM